MKGLTFDSCIHCYLRLEKGGKFAGEEEQLGEIPPASPHFLDMVENHKMIVENSGLLSVAALKQMDCKGKKVVCILSGGNMDVITMSSIVQHGLIQRDRIFSVSVLLPDKPGELVRVAATIAEEQGNVIKLEHNQFVSTNRQAAVELRITMEAFGTEHKHRILEALEKKGFRPKQIGTKLY